MNNLSTEREPSLQRAFDYGLYRQRRLSDGIVAGTWPTQQEYLRIQEAAENMTRVEAITETWKLFN